MKKFCLALLCINFTFFYSEISTAQPEDFSKWKVVKEIDLEVEPNSPLDMSVHFDERVIALEKVSIDSEGDFSIAGRKTRFLCAAMSLTPPYGGFPDKASIDKYVNQLYRAGYSLVRFHYIDATLMDGMRDDFSYSAEQLDRFHYFLFKLKSKGIYWLIDVVSSENAAYGSVFPHRWVNLKNFKMRIYYDHDALVHFSGILKSLYARVNPYTGVSVLRDPALMGLIPVNEAGLNFIYHTRKSLPVELKVDFVKFLKRKGSIDYMVPRYAATKENLLKGEIVLPPSTSSDPLLGDLLEYFVFKEIEHQSIIKNELRKFGYSGLIAFNNSMPRMQNIYSQQGEDWIDMHSYHDEVFSHAPGSSIKNISEFETGFEYIKNLLAVKQVGKAFSVSEWGHPYWNEWRYEAGLIFPVFASKNSWGMISQHASSSVDISYGEEKNWKKSILPYSVGLDPIARASEYLAFFLYARGDVKPYSLDRVVQFPGLGSPEKPLKAFGNKSYTWFFNEIMYQGAVSVNAGSLDSQLGLCSYGNSMLCDLYSAFKRIPQENHLMTADGEFKVNFRDKVAVLTTPKSQAALVGPALASVSTGNMVINKPSERALVALISLTKNNIKMTDRALLIVSTDAVNSNSSFSGVAGREVVEKIGKLPPLIKPVKMKLRFEIDKNIYSVRPVLLNGKIDNEFVVKFDRKGIDLDTSLANRGYLYFFLELN